MIALSLRLNGFRVTQERLQKYLPAKLIAQSYNMVVGQQVEIVSRMVRVAGHHTPIRRPSCLVESLTLWWLLRRQGILSHIRIGIRKDRGKFQAHAWVEYRGEAINDAGAEHRHYAAFDAAFSLPHAENQ
jgi:hypothetical protein